jgi:hypothetical protein
MLSSKDWVKAKILIHYETHENPVESLLDDLTPELLQEMLEHAFDAGRKSLADEVGRLVNE